MKNIFVFVVFATVLFSNLARSSNLVAKNSAKKECDFSNWHGYTPNYGDTCVRLYMSTFGNWYKAPYPWCYHKDGSWSYCQTYDWKIEYHRHLVKSESRRKQYYYNYDFTGKTYKEAEKICRDEGEGWKVASFQTQPSYQLDNQNKKIFAKSGEVYEQSVRNIERALHPLVETWDVFWVRSAEGCMDYDDNNHLQENKGCEGRRSFVCEKDL